MRWLKSIMCGAMGTALIGAAHAHHSFNMYDYSTDKPLAGTVKLFTWANPHGLIELVVPQPSGAAKTWNIELSSPNILGRRGWSSHSLHVGENLKVTVHPMRNGRPVCLLVNVTTPDGTQLSDSAGAIKKDE